MSATKDAWTKIKAAMTRSVTGNCSFHVTSLNCYLNSTVEIIRKLVPNLSILDEVTGLWWQTVHIAEVFWDYVQQSCKEVLQPLTFCLCKQATSCLILCTNINQQRKLTEAQLLLWQLIVLLSQIATASMSIYLFTASSEVCYWHLSAFHCLWLNGTLH